jgi:hypothetical protein
VVALAVVLFLECALVAVWVSALQVQIPRNMPFGVTGSSPVVTAAESTKVMGYQVSFVNTTYPNEATATDAINEGKIYGAYLTGTSSDTLLVSQAKSFFAYTEVVPPVRKDGGDAGATAQRAGGQAAASGQGSGRRAYRLAAAARDRRRDRVGDPDLHLDRPAGAALAGGDPGGVLAARRTADRRDRGTVDRGLRGR